MNDRLYQLRQMKIEVTDSCPLACVHCSSSASPSKSHFVSWTDWVRIVSEASSLGLEELSISGGEPLLWPFLSEAVGDASERGISTTIYTSGNIEDPDKTFRQLAEAGLHRAIFSVYAADQSFHESITRVRGSFARTHLAMQSAKRNGLSIELHFVPLSSTYKQLPGVTEFAELAGAERVSILRFVPQGRGALLENEVLSRLQTMELRRAVTRLRSDGHNIRVGSPYNILLLDSNARCLAGIDRMVVNPNLTIAPCDAFKTISPQELGLASEYTSLATSSLEDCWLRSPLLAAIRAYIRRPRGGECAACNSLTLCSGGCPGQKVIHYGSLVEKPDPLCIRKGEL